MLQPARWPRLGDSAKVSGRTRLKRSSTANQGRSQEEDYPVPAADTNEPGVSVDRAACDLVRPTAHVFAFARCDRTRTRRWNRSGCRTQDQFECTTHEYNKNHNRQTAPTQVRRPRTQQDTLDRMPSARGGVVHVATAHRSSQVPTQETHAGLETPPNDRV